MKKIIFILSVFSLNFAFAQEEVVEEQKEETIYMVVEEMPIFSEVCLALEGNERLQCSSKKLQEYMAKVDYPQVAIENNVQGKVYLSFVVDTNGSVIDVKLLRSADKLLDDAALKHIKNMPAFFKPGYQTGKAVLVKYSVPIGFQLSGGSSYKPLTNKELKQLKKETNKKIRAIKRE